MHCDPSEDLGEVKKRVAKIMNKPAEDIRITKVWRFCNFRVLP